MLFEIYTYKDSAAFNLDAQRRNTMIERDQPGWSSDRYWQVAGFKVANDGGLTVVWMRKTTAV